MAKQPTGPQSTMPRERIAPWVFQALGCGGIQDAFCIAGEIGRHRGSIQVLYREQTVLEGMSGWLATTLDMGDQGEVRPRERVTVSPSRQWEAA